MLRLGLSAMWEKPAQDGDVFDGFEFCKRRLPASAFPEPALVYVCDGCGKDITRHLHRRRGPTWTPMGPARYTCACGRRWLTGAVEWDYLGEWDRRHRVRSTLGCSAFLAIPSLLLGALLYLVLHGWRWAAITATVVAALPLALSVLPGSIAVAASIWRTRFRPHG